MSASVSIADCLKLGRQSACLWSPATEKIQPEWFVIWSLLLGSQQGHVSISGPSKFRHIIIMITIWVTVFTYQSSHLAFIRNSQVRAWCCRARRVELERQSACLWSAATEKAQHKLFYLRPVACCYWGNWIVHVPLTSWPSTCRAVEGKRVNKGTSALWGPFQVAWCIINIIIFTVHCSFQASALLSYLHIISNLDKAQPDECLMSKNRESEDRKTICMPLKPGHWKSTAQMICRWKLVAWREWRDHTVHVRVAP